MIFTDSTVLYSLSTKLWKIADFGLTSKATTTAPVATSGGRGKPCYRAPELMLESKPTYNKKTDIWSLGCILYELCVGEKAFGGDMAAVIFAQKGKMRTVTIDVSEPRNMYLSWLISHTLHPNPSNRPSAAAIQQKFSELKPVATEVVENLDTSDPLLRTGPENLVYRNERALGMANVHLPQASLQNERPPYFTQLIEVTKYDISSSSNVVCVLLI